MFEIRQGMSQEETRAYLERLANVEHRQILQRQELQQRRAEAQEYIRRQIEIEREQIRLEREQAERERAWTKRQEAIEREQIRLKKEQERQAKEMARQAQILKKHEARILALEQKIALAEHDLAFYRPQVEKAEQEVRELDNKVWYFTKHGLPCQGYKDQLERKQKALHNLQTKVIKAEQAKALAEKQMQAA